jgi:hypothetical protein
MSSQETPIQHRSWLQGLLARAAAPFSSAQIERLSDASPTNDSNAVHYPNAGQGLQQELSLQQELTVQYERELQQELASQPELASQTRKLVAQDQPTLPGEHAALRGLRELSSAVPTTAPRDAPSQLRRRHDDHAPPNQPLVGYRAQPYPAQPPNSAVGTTRGQQPVRRGRRGRPIVAGASSTRGGRGAAVVLGISSNRGGRAASTRVGPSSARGGPSATRPYARRLRDGPSNATADDSPNPWSRRGFVGTSNKE